MVTKCANNELIFNKDQVGNMSYLKQKMQVKPKPESRLSQSRQINMIYISQYMSQLTLHDQQLNQMTILSQQLTKVVQTILEQKHQHLQTSIIQSLFRLIQSQQSIVEAICPEILETLQQIRQKDLLQMLIQEIKCGVCSPKYNQFYFSHYDKLLNLILWYKQKAFSCLQDYISFFKLNEALFRSHITRSIDSLWSDSIKKTIRHSQEKAQNCLQQFEIQDVANHVVSSQKIQESREIRKRIEKQIRSQLHFYQISFELMKLYSSTAENEKNVSIFYQRHIKPASANDLIIVAKIVEQTFDYCSSKLSSFLHARLILPIKNRLGNAYTFSLKPRNQAQLRFQDTQKKITHFSQFLWTAGKPQPQFESSPLKPTQPNISPLKKSVNIFNIKQFEEPFGETNQENVKTVQQLERILLSLKIADKSPSRIAQQSIIRAAMLENVKNVKIKNLIGCAQGKKKMVDTLIEVSCQYPELVNASFQNSLVYCSMQQLPQKLKLHFKGSRVQIKNEYQKCRQRHLRRFKGLYDLFKIE